MALIIAAFHGIKRSRITYALGFLYLAFFSYIMWQLDYETVHQIAASWSQKSDKTQILADLFIRLVFTALFLKLCHCFIFGLPSRRFYRLTKK